MTIDYARTCFVVMPFGEKPVEGHLVNFDHIYDTIFRPAITRVVLPEGGTLVPMRCDKEMAAGLITQEMFRALEYSRMAVADISGLNANVFLELGIRYRARASGTALFRQEAQPLPFDVTQIKAFPYAYDPEDEAERSRALIAEVLSESLRHNQVDSPAWQALLAQRTHGGPAEEALRLADQAQTFGDLAVAELGYAKAIRLDSANPLSCLKLGLVRKALGDWAGALEAFDAAIRLSAEYPEPWREKGIAENKLWHKARSPLGQADGTAALLRALDLDPDDFDAAAALGGALKRQGDFAGAVAMYRRSLDISRGHPYPLLNLIACQARADGVLDLDSHRVALRKAERQLRPQVEKTYQAPWTFFDLAEICLLTGRQDEGIELIKLSLPYCAHDAWCLTTFRDTLQLFADGCVDLPALAAARARLDQAIAEAT